MDQNNNGQIRLNLLEALDTLSRDVAALPGEHQSLLVQDLSQVENILERLSFPVPVDFYQPEALQVSKAYLSDRSLLLNIFDALPFSIACLDRDGNYLAANRQYSLGVGKHQTVIKDVHFSQVLPAYLFEKHKLMIEECLKGRSVPFEDNHPAVNGAPVYTKGVYVPFLDSLGEVQGVVVGYMDITDRKMTEVALRVSTARSRLILNQLPATVWTADSNLRFTSISGPVLTTFNLTPNQIVGMSMYEFQQANGSDYFSVEKHLVALNGEVVSYENQASDRVWETHLEPMRDTASEVIGIIGLSMDVSERKRAEALLEQKSEELRSTHEKLKSWVNNLEKRNQEANLLRQMGDLLQVCNESSEAHAVIGEFGPKLFPTTSGALYIISNSRRVVEAMAVWGDDLLSERVFAPDECWALRRGQVHQVISPSTSLGCQHVIRPFEGAYLDVPMMASGESLGLLHVESSESDINDSGFQELARSVAEHLALSLSNLRLRETLRAQSIRDPLTGLFNRRYMEESLEREIHRAARRRSPVGVIMIDIDHFKNFNDIYGHDAGDAVLRKMGQLLQGNIRKEDIACRFGGEEFILILPDAPLEAARVRAELIRDAVKSMTVEYQHQSLGVITVSIGVAAFKEMGIHTDEILRRVDEILYEAKHRGRDCVVVAGNELEPA